MPSKYNDTTAVLQVIGCVYNNPSLLDITDKYVITDEDFANDFHRTVFGAIYKLWESGAKKITLGALTDFFAVRPKSEALYKTNKGDEWLAKISENAIPSTFDYYYNRLKKFSLLRAYDKCGIDVTDIYDPDNILDAKKRQAQEEFLDNNSLEKIADKIDGKIEQIKLQYVDNSFGEAYQAAEGIEALIENLKKHPEAGIPLYGPLINTVTKGARLGKFYLRSSQTGLGKTRSLVADACYFACEEIKDEQFGWIKTGKGQPTLFIATEQDLSEIQTLMLAFLSNVNEEHIISGMYDEGEEEDVAHAVKLLKDAPLYIETIPDFSLMDIENCIKKNIREHDVSYIAFDYLHTSMKILEEVTRRSGGVKLREDNVLFMLATKLKDICNQYHVFLISATQLNSNYVESETPDQNLLRGSKAIADRIDLGMIMLSVSDEDLVKLEPVLATGQFINPTIKISIYKNRRGKYKSVFLWCAADLGTCRIKPMFCTAYNYSVVPIDNYQYILEDEPCAF